MRPTRFRDFVFGMAVWVLLAVGVWSCSNPAPIPTPTPNPVVDAGPAPDPFMNRILDCRLAPDQRPEGAVRTCLDSANTTECLNGLAGGSTEASVLAVIGCPVRDLEMRLAVKAVKRTATDDELAQLEAASRWINEHGLGFYAE